MFWVCYTKYHSGSRRPHRTWVIEAEQSPDELDENGECLFTEMGGHVHQGGYDTYQLAREAENDLMDTGMMPGAEPLEVVEGEVVGGQVKVLFPDGTELICRVGPTNAAGNTLIWVPVHGTWLKMWKGQELLKEIVPVGGVLLAESSADPRLRGGAA